MTIPEPIAEIIGEVISYVGVLTTAIFGYLTVRYSNKLKKQKEESKNLKETVYDLNELRLKEMFDLQRFSELELLIKKMFEETKVNRFGVVFVMNGKTNPDYLTVLFDQKLGDTTIGAFSPYTRFEIDDPYRRLVKRIEVEKMVFGKTTDPDLGIIAEYMEMEEIVSCGWHYLDRVELDKNNDVLLFSIVSSTAEKDFSFVEKKKIKLMLDSRIAPKIRQIISTEIQGDKVSENGE